MRALAISTFLKDFTDQKRDEKMYKKVPIFRCTTPSTGKRLGEVANRNIGTFLYIFSSRFWSVKSFKTCQNASQDFNFVQCTCCNYIDQHCLSLTLKSDRLLP